MPEFHSFVVADDVAIFGAAVEVSASSVGDVAEVAEQGALVAGKDFLVQLQRLFVADGGDEVFDVLDVSLAALDFLVHLVGRAVEEQGKSGSRVIDDEYRSPKRSADDYSRTTLTRTA